MKKHICELLCLLDNQHITDDHIRWEYLKNEIRKFTKNMLQLKNVRKEKDSIEKELKHLETDLKNYKTSQKYLDCISKLDEVYSRKADKVSIRSKCDWYKTDEKSSKFFLNLEKTRAY